MNSRERIISTLNHKTPDKLPIDFGATSTTGIHVSVVYKLRQYFGLDKPDTPVKVIEPYQMLGEIGDDLKEAIGIDATLLNNGYSLYGYKLENWKFWRFWDSTPLLVPEGFNTEKEDDGRIYQYPEGDKASRPSGVMPRNGYFFDSIIRQEPIVEEKLDPLSNTEEFKIINENDLKLIAEKVNNLYEKTDFAIVGSLVSSGFGDIALVPGPMLKNPKGIRDISEWYISLLTRKAYIKKVFEIQCEIALENYKRIFKTVGNKINVVFVSGTDFGSQDRPFISKELYCELFKPFHIKINNWIHENTKWKTFIHTCGSIFDLIPEFIEAGFDILNPVQISAKDMDPLNLKNNFGKYLTFWGGGIDTQKVLAFGTPSEVRNNAEKLINIFFKDGGFVFNSVHNIQANVPIENIIALIEILKKYR